MSDRSVADYSLNAWIADAAAVAESVGHPLPVYASGLQGPAAIALAVRHPDLVSHLVLMATASRGEGMAQTPQHRAGPALADIAVPTLIVESRKVPSTLHLGSRGRELSRHIPGAGLVPSQDRDGTKTNILRFLDADPERSHGAFRTIMFTDLVSSTAPTQRVGDDAAQQVVEAHDAAVQAALAAHNGAKIKHTGDGIMAGFDSAADAARAAQQIASGLTSQGVGVRIGLNAGEPIDRDGDLFDTAVQLAARVRGQTTRFTKAAPHLCCSSVVRPPASGEVWPLHSPAKAPISRCSRRRRCSLQRWDNRSRRDFVQLAIEHCQQPPFAGGALSKVDDDVIERLALYIEDKD